MTSQTLQFLQFIPLPESFCYKYLGSAVLKSFLMSPCLIKHRGIFSSLRWRSNLIQLLIVLSVASWWQPCLSEIRGHRFRQLWHCTRTPSATYTHTKKTINAMSNHKKNWLSSTCRSVSQTGVAPAAHLGLTQKVESRKWCNSETNKV